MDANKFYLTELVYNKKNLKELEELDVQLHIDKADELIEDQSYSFYLKGATVEKLNEKGVQTSAIEIDEKTKNEVRTTKLDSNYTKEFLDYSQIKRRITWLLKAHSDNLSVEELKYKSTGCLGINQPRFAKEQKILMLKVTNQKSKKSKERKPALLVVAGVHGDEPLNPLIAMEFVQHLLKSSNKSKQVRRILNTREVFVIPVLNPDGLNYMRASGNTIGNRKNRNKIHTQVIANEADIDKIGVDINRNFPFRFDKHDGEEEDPKNSMYAGDTPLSEFESRNIDWVLQQNQNIDIVVDLHSDATGSKAKCIYPGKQFINMVGQYYNYATSVHDRYAELLEFLQKNLNATDSPTKEGESSTFIPQSSGVINGTLYAYSLYCKCRHSFLFETPTQRGEFSPELKSYFKPIINALKKLALNANDRSPNTTPHQTCN